MMKVRSLIKAFLLFYSLSFTIGLASFFVVLVLLKRNPIGHVSVGFAGMSFEGVGAIGVVGIVCLSFAFFASSWAAFLGSTRSWFRCLGILAVLSTSLVASCALGGVAWVFEDMCAGYFPEYPRITHHFLWGIETALMLGPQMLYNSLPMFFTYLVAGYILTDQLTQRLTSPTIQPD